MTAFRMFAYSVLTLAMFAPLNIASAQTITYPQVLNLLELKIDEDAILKRVGGTSFVLDAKQEADLRKAGASDRLITALKKVNGPARDETPANWVYILDCSRSMSEATKDGPTKMEAAKKAVIELLRDTPNGLNLAFVIYGHDAALECAAVKVVRPLGPIDADGKAELGLMITELQPTGHTPISLALEVAGKQLATKPGRGGIVLITDGMETCNRNPVDEAGKLKLALGVNVVGFGLNDDERKSVKAIAEAGKGKYYDADGAAALKKELAVVVKAVAAAAKPELPAVANIAGTSVDKPAALPYGTTGKMTLGQNESAYVAVSLPAGESMVCFDSRRGRSGNLINTISILDEDGAEVARNFMGMNEVDHGTRYARVFSPKKAGKFVFRVTNTQSEADFWLTFGPTNKFVPIFGETVPAPLQVGQEVKGELENGESAYYVVTLPKGEYKVIAGFDNSQGRNTNLIGYVATAQAEGGHQKGVIGFNEVDVTARKNAVLAVKQDSTVILRVKNDSAPVKYSLRIRPNGE